MRKLDGWEYAYIIMFLLFLILIIYLDRAERKDAQTGMLAPRPMISISPRYAKKMVKVEHDNNLVSIKEIEDPSMVLFSVVEIKSGNHWIDLPFKLTCVFERPTYMEICEYDITRYGDISDLTCNALFTITRSSAGRFYIDISKGKCSAELLEV